MSLQSLKEKLFKNEAFRDEYFKKDLAFEIAQMLLEARAEKGMTQAKLAEKTGTKQPSIARIESGSTLPSLSFLKRIAEAFDSYLVPPTFGFMPNYPNREIYPSKNDSAVAVMFVNVKAQHSEESAKEGAGSYTPISIAN